MPQFETVEVVAVESGGKNAAHLFVIAGDFQFLDSPANCHVIHEDLRLIEGAMCDARQLSKFQVAEMLDSDPYPDSEYRENQSQRTAGRPQQKQAQHGEDSRNAIQKDHDLAMGHAMLQEFVVNVLAVRGEDGTPTDEAAHDGECSLENGQAKRDDWDCDGDNRRSLLRTLQRQRTQHE